MGNNYELVDVVVLNYNDSGTTIDFLKQIKMHNAIRNIIVVDNNSSDNSYELLNNYKSKKIHVLHTPHNGGYGYGNNYGCKYCLEVLKSKYVLICNPDIIVKNHSIMLMYEQIIKNDDVVACACVMKNINGIRCYDTAWEVPTFLQIVCHNLIFLEKFFNKGYRYYDISENINSAITVGCVQGSMFLVNLKLFQSIGGFDERVFLYNEENILGYKAKNNGYKMQLLLQENYLHMHSISIDKSYSSLYSKWKVMLDSQKILLSEYVKIGRFKLFMAYISMLIRLIELYLIAILKKVRFWR